MLVEEFRKAMIAFDEEYITTKSDIIYADYQTTVMMKRQVMTVLSNAGSQSEQYSIAIPMKGTLVNATGMQVTDIIACRTVTILSTGDILTSIANGMLQVPSSHPFLYQFWDMEVVLTSGMDTGHFIDGNELYMWSPSR